MLKDIEKIFTSEDKEELKQTMKRIIIEQFKSDMYNSHCYLLDPNNVSKWLEEAMVEIRDDCKEEYKQIIKERMEKEMEDMFENFKNSKLN